MKFQTIMQWYTKSGPYQFAQANFQFSGKMQNLIERLNRMNLELNKLYEKHK